VSADERYRRRYLDEFRRTSVDRIARISVLWIAFEKDPGGRETAEELMRESMALSRLAGDEQMADQTNHSLADLNLDRGTLDEAATLYAESLRLAVKRAESRAIVYCIAGIAAVLAGRGKEEDAAFLWGAAEGAEVRAGFRMLASERVRYSSRAGSA